MQDCNFNPNANVGPDDGEADHSLLPGAHMRPQTEPARRSGTTFVNGLPSPATSFTSTGATVAQPGPTWSFQSTVGDATQDQVAVKTIEQNAPKGKGKRRASDTEPNAHDTHPTSNPTRPSLGASLAVRRKRSRLAGPGTTLSSLSATRAPPSPRKAPFTNIFNEIVHNDMLLLHFTLRLPLNDLVSLYAISKDFHYRVNCRYTTFISSYARWNAPQSSLYCPWKFFPQLLISDPLLRPTPTRPHLARDIPSLKWVQLVMYRDTAIKKILTILALEGHQFPPQISATLMKFWLLASFPTNVARRAFASNPMLWTDEDLYLIHMFMVKLDMRFSHPINGSGECELGALLLMQPSLTPLLKTLQGLELSTYDDLVAMVVRTLPKSTLHESDEFNMLDDEETTGILEEDMGILSKEHHHKNGAYLNPATEVLKKEALRRSLYLQRFVPEMMLYGYVDNRTGRNIPNPRVKPATKFGQQDRVIVPKRALPPYSTRAKHFKEQVMLWKEAGWKRVGKETIESIIMPFGDLATEQDM